MKFAGYIVEYWPDGNRKNARCIKSGIATAANAKAIAQADYVSEAHKSENQVARPLHVLQPLIAKDLKAGKKATLVAMQAAVNAGLPYYKAAGEKLLEAKAQIAHGEFEDWCKRNFKLSPRTAREYMSLARTTADIENGSALPFSSLREFIKETATPRNELKPAIDRTTHIHNLHEESLKRAEEREERRKLAHRLIDRGYKSLAAELHPDKGGPSEAMARLNWVRDHLRNMA